MESKRRKLPLLQTQDQFAEVMPVSLASSLDLSLQEVDSEKYKLVSANGTPINVLFE